MTNPAGFGVKGKWARGILKKKKTSMKQVIVAHILLNFGLGYDETNHALDHRRNKKQIKL